MRPLRRCRSCHRRATSRRLRLCIPMHRPPLRMVGVWGVSTGAGYAIRAWTVFEKAHVAALRAALAATEQPETDE